MSALATRTWLRRLAAAVPSAWRYDRIFRGAVISAGVALVLLILRLAGPPEPSGAASAPGAAAPATLGPTYATSHAGSPAAPPAPGARPNIAPGRSLDGVTITPALEDDRFGTVSPASRK
jgi:hypothetical protein